MKEEEKHFQGSQRAENCNQEPFMKEVECKDDDDLALISKVYSDSDSQLSESCSVVASSIEEESSKLGNFSFILVVNIFNLKFS